MDFEWDEDKAEANRLKHGVPFEEAATVFLDPLLETIFDPGHSKAEDRYLTIGMSSEDRLVILCHTDRGEKIRMISAREPTTKERKDYEDGLDH